MMELVTLAPPVSADQQVSLETMAARAPRDYLVPRAHEVAREGLARKGWLAVMAEAIRAFQALLALQDPQALWVPLAAPAVPVLQEWQARPAAVVPQATGAGAAATAVAHRGATPTVGGMTRGTLRTTAGGECQGLLDRLGQQRVMAAMAQTAHPVCLELQERLERLELTVRTVPTVPTARMVVSRWARYPSSLRAVSPS
mmetsp:Transcript_13589/g.31320  ORF Transcript_13589/g.31320 Transcript_13589/m.31320 type:complete len:200 (+) Transcript_13589:729-1328(+)